MISKCCYRMRDSWKKGLGVMELEAGLVMEAGEFSREKVEDSKARGGTGKMGPPAEKGWVEKWRRDLKIAG